MIKRLIILSLALSLFFACDGFSCETAPTKPEIKTGDGVSHVPDWLIGTWTDGFEEFEFRFTSDNFYITANGSEKSIEENFKDNTPKYQEAIGEGFYEILVKYQIEESESSVRYSFEKETDIHVEFTTYSFSGSGPPVTINLNIYKE